MADTTLARRYRSVGRYRVYTELASGGMATVHLGCLLGPAGFSKLVAIKCLHEEFALEPNFVSMFLDEARLVSAIHHPNVVASLDVVAEQGQLLLVMEYVHGETLATLLRSSRQSGDQPSAPVVIRVVCDALEGLHAAHVASVAGQSLNIVHRDVSPQNIMVGADGNSRVLDFGVAQAALRSHVTAAGTVKGKIAYMSPEQVQGDVVDARTDIFAAGVVLWEALTGRRLFFAANPREGIARLLEGAITPPSELVPGLPVELDRVVLKALQRDREERFQTARHFAEALRRAMPEGSRSDVAEWVGRVAKESLSWRRELLQALQASAQQDGNEGRGWSTPSRPARAAQDSATRVTSVTSVVPSAGRASWHRRASRWAAALGLAGTAAAFCVDASLPPRSTTAPLVPHVAKANQPAPAIRISAAKPEGSASAALPAPSADSSIPVVAAESLLLASSSEAAPSTKARRTQLGPPAPAGLKLALTKTTRASDKKRAALADTTPPLATAIPTSATTSPVLAKATPTAAAPAACNPPYLIDAKGIRRVKVECL